MIVAKRPVCSVEGCDTISYQQGWCIKHFRRWQAHGDPLAILTDRGKPLIERFMNRIRVDGVTGCWMWTKGTSGSGYGTFAIAHKQNVIAHVWSYEYHVGPRPEGLTLDHTCHSESDCAGGLTCPHRRCCNPDHLELVTLRTNLLRGNTFAAANAAKTHCPHGHEYTPENTRVYKGMRSCRICGNRRSREYEARKRAAAKLT